MQAGHGTMRPNTKIVLVGVLVTALIAAWAVKKQGPQSTESAVSAPVQETRDKQRGAVPSPTVPSAAPSARATPQHRQAGPPASLSAIATEFVSSRNLKQFFDRYERNWRSASPEVKHYLLKALNHCAPFLGSAFDTAPRPPLVPETAKDRPLYAERLSAAEKFKAECAGFERLQGSTDLIADLRAGAAEGGFPGTQAMQLSGLHRSGKVAEAASRMVALLEGPVDYEVVNGLANYFSTRYSELQFGDHKPRQQLYADAWRLVMCDYGMDCSGNSRGLNVMCMQQGACGVSSLEEYYGRFRYSPADFDELSRMRAQLNSGLQQRNPALLGIPAAAKRGDS
jgi:hypothetical protein